MSKKSDFLRFIGATIIGNNFINNHKEKLKDFTRNRVLSFPVVLMLILKKSVKSLQLILNELFIQNYIDDTVSSSAYTQARKKFKHTAFIELNEGTVDIYYSDNKIKRWKGYRILGVDASKIMLPDTREIQNEFGAIPIKSQHVEDSYTSAMFECCYDVLNHIVVKSSLNHGSSYEVDLAINLLNQPNKTNASSEKDLNIYDRAYASYEFLAYLAHYKREHVVRCPVNSFKAVTKSLFDGSKKWSQVVTLKAPKDKKTELINKGLPTEITVRFVSVVLSTGEVEVLATSLMSPLITRKEFKNLYYLRWGVEGFFNLIKGRLNIENFTGKSLESVKQDFWSTIFITNVETLFSEETEEEINRHLKENQLPRKINKAVSFNAIKNMAFELFFNETDRDETNEKLTKLFRTNMIVQRQERNHPRKKISVRKSLNFQKRCKKHVY